MYATLKTGKDRKYISPALNRLSWFFVGLLGGGTRELGSSTCLMSRHGLKLASHGGRRLYFTWYLGGNVPRKTPLMSLVFGNFMKGQSGLKENCKSAAQKTVDSQFLLLIRLSLRCFCQMCSCQSKQDFYFNIFHANQASAERRLLECRFTIWADSLSDCCHSDFEPTWHPSPARGGQF